MIDTILILLALICVWQIGRALVRHWVQKSALAKLADSVIKQVHMVRVEQHAGDFFWYDADSDMFIAQGHTVPDIIEVLKTVHPTKVFIFKDYVFAGPDFAPVRITSEEIV